MTTKERVHPFDGRETETVAVHNVAGTSNTYRCATLAVLLAQLQSSLGISLHALVWLVVPALLFLGVLFRLGDLSLDGAGGGGEVRSNFGESAIMGKTYFVTFIECDTSEYHSQIQPW